MQNHRTYITFHIVDLHLSSLLNMLKKYKNVKHCNQMKLKMLCISQATIWRNLQDFEVINLPMMKMTDQTQTKKNALVRHHSNS